MTRGKRQTLLVTGLLNLGVFAGVGVLVPFFPKEAQKRGLTTSTCGLIFVMYPLTLFLFSPFLGTYISHIRPRVLLVIGLVVNGSANTAFGFMDHVQGKGLFVFGCILCRAIAGFSTTLINAEILFLKEAFPQNINRAVALHEIFTGFGTSIGPPIGGLLYDFGSFGVPLWSMGLFMICQIPVILYILPDLPLQSKNSVSNSEFLWKLIKSPILVINLWITLLVAAGWTFLDPIIEPEMRNNFRASSSTVGAVLFVFACAYVLPNPLWGWIADRIRKKWTLILIGCFGSGAAMLLLGPAPVLHLPNNIWILTGALLLHGMFTGLSFIPTYGTMLDDALLRGFDDDDRTSSFLYGFWYSIYALGESVGPATGSVLTENFGFKFTCTVMGITFFLTGGVVFLYFSTTCILRYAQRNEHEQNLDSGKDEPFYTLKRFRIYSGSNMLNNCSQNESSPLLTSTSRYPSSSF